MTIHTSIQQRLFLLSLAPMLFPASAATDLESLDDRIIAPLALLASPAAQKRQSFANLFECWDGFLPTY